MKFIILLSCLLCVGLARGQDSDGYRFKKYFADSARTVIIMERDSVDGYEIRKVTTIQPSFHVQRIPKGEDYEPIVISEIDTLTDLSAAEGAQGEIQVSARIEEHGSFNKIMWRKHLDANLINYFDEYLESVTYGCCGAENSRELFRYGDGRSIMMLTSNLFSIEIPNTKLKRYFGVLSNTAAKWYEDINDSLLCAVLTYTDPITLQSQRLIIDYKDQDAMDSLGIEAIDQITLQPSLDKDKENYNYAPNLDLWSKDGVDDPTGFSDLSVQLHIYGEEELTISVPIKKDKINIEGLKSSMFTFRMK